jgi:hypothetical protein
MTRVRLGRGQCCLPVGAWLTRGLARRGAPSSHQSIGGPSPSWLAGELNGADVAELSELLRSTGLHGQHLVDVECVQVAAAEPVAA